MHTMIDIRALGRNPNVRIRPKSGRSNRPRECQLTLEMVISRFENCRTTVHPSRSFRSSVNFAKY